MIITPTDAAFTDACGALSFYEWQPDRRPAGIAQPQTHEDVVRIVKSTAHDGTPLAVRSGGNSLSATFLRDGALTLDLRNLLSSSFNPAVGAVTFGTGHTVASSAKFLESVGRAAPIGHAPTVGLGGYLLAGGNGWNAKKWGHGSDAILAATVVWADGSSSRITPKDGAIFQALAGGGPLFPGVVTSFELRTYPAPASVRRTSVNLDVVEPTQAGEQLEQVLERLPSHTEVTAFYRPSITDSSPVQLIVSATSFPKAGEGDGFESLELIGGTNPVRRRAEVTSYSSLAAAVADLPQHAGEGVFSHHLWTDAPLGEALGALPATTLGLGPCSCVLISTSPQNTSDSVYSPLGRVSISAYAHWNPSEDEAQFHIAWARETIASLANITSGRYIGEADLTRGIDLSQYYLPTAQAILAEVSKEYDPTARFMRPDGSGD